MAHGTRSMAHVGWHTAHGTRHAVSHSTRREAAGTQRTARGAWHSQPQSAAQHMAAARHTAQSTRHTPSSTHHGAHGIAHTAQLMAHGTGLMAHSTRHMVHGTRLTARGRGIELGRGRSTAPSLPPLPWIFRPAAQRGGSPVAGRLRHSFKAVAAPKHSSYKALLLLSPAGGFQVTNPC